MTEEDKQEEQTQELALQLPQQGGMVIRSDAEMEELEKEIQRRFAIQEKMIKFALSKTKPSDWINQSGKPYLQATGAEKILKPFGLSVINAEYERENEPRGTSGEFLYTCACENFTGIGDSFFIQHVDSCKSRTLIK